MFPTEDKAREYLEGRRWKDGITCPCCESDRVTRQKDQRYLRCKYCRQIFTVRTGTMFERSKIPLSKWLYAMHVMAARRKDISTLRLSKELGITQKSAWFMLHRLRDDCKDDSPLLIAKLEVDNMQRKNKKALDEMADKALRPITLKAICGTPERLLKVGEVEIEC